MTEASITEDKAVGPARSWVCVSLMAVTALLLANAPAAAQAGDEPGFVLGADGKGIGIGDVRRLDGLRLSFRDRELERVRGINLTVWRPHDDLADGRVGGLALGLPLTGARTLTGLGVGAGVAVLQDFRGLGVAGLGMGAGRDLEGVHVAGLGMGAGRDVRGFAVAGLGMGLGGDATGILLGGLGMGVGGDLTGLGVGGLGAGIGGSLKGIFVGGLGGGVGGDARGVILGGVGAGVGGDLVGLGIGGVGFGVGGELKGLAITGVGVGAERIRGLVLSGVGAGGLDVRGFVVAPAYFQVGSDDDRGEFRGVSISAWNRIRGSQRGITIGLLNVAEELHGLQIGLINIARNKESFSVMPIANWSR